MPGGSLHQRTSSKEKGEKQSKETEKGTEIKSSKRGIRDKESPQPKDGIFPHGNRECLVAVFITGLER
jgi:hypothetical protein